MDLSNLSLEELPEDVLKLENLEFLNLGGNKLSSLPLNLDRLTKLRTIFFANNEFTTIPKVLGNLPSLFMLSFKGNKIETIDIESLSPSIGWLILTDNRLETLPSSIGKLSKLRKLMLSGNRLTALPIELSACRDLELIRLASNEIQSLPDWVCDLPKLSWIALSGNPLTSAHREEVSKDPIPMNDFEISNILGEGTSGVVKRAIWRSKSLEVALKVFKSISTSDGNPLDEMRAALSIGRHPNTPLVHGAVRDGSQLGLILNLVPQSYTSLGKPPSFDTVTRDVYDSEVLFSEEEVMRTLLGIASICAHLHARGISHGDLYAHNILVDRVGTLGPLLCDYGAATFYDRSQGIDFEPLEVRAYGLLGQELLDRINGGKCYSFDKIKLNQLILSCLSESPKMRPTFHSIFNELSQISGLNSRALVSPCDSITPSNTVIVGTRINFYHTVGATLFVIALVLLARFTLFNAGFLRPNDNSHRKREF